MKIPKRKTVALLTIFAGFFLIPFLYSQDEDFISVAPVEKQNNEKTLENGTVEKAEKPAPTPAAATVSAEKGKITIDKILATELKDKIKVLVVTSEKVKYNISELAPPPNIRILLQLPGCDVKAGTIEVKKGNIEKIRTAPHNATAWVVIDMNAKQKWQVNTDGNKIIIDIMKGAGVKQAEPAAPTHKIGRIIYRIVDIAAKDLDKTTRVIITTDGPVKYRVMKDSANNLIKLNVIEAVSIWKENKINVNKGSVNNVSLKENPNDKTADINLNLNTNTPYTVTRDQNQIVINIDHPMLTGKKAKKELDLYQKISINVQNASLPAVLRLIAAQTGFEFSTSPSVAGVATGVTIKEEDQPVITVLRDILVPLNFYYDVRNGIVKVGTVAELKAEKALMPQITKFYYSRSMKAADLYNLLNVRMTNDPLLNATAKVDTGAGQDRLMIVGTPDDVSKVMEMIASIDAGGEGNTDEGGGIKTKIFKLKNIRLQQVMGDSYETDFEQEIKQTLTDLLSADGKLDIDRRTSSLIVTDNVRVLKKVQKVVEQLDVRVPQVTIESKIYEVDLDALKQLGVSWGPQGGSAGNITSQNTTQGNANITSQGTEPFIQGLVNAPVINPTGTLTFGTIMNGFNIQASLQALQTNNEANLLSAPKVTVASNKPATISTSETTYFSQQSVVTSQTGAPVVTTQYLPILLPITLQVIPHISDTGDNIELRVGVMVTRILTPSSSGAPPDLNTQSATTYVRVKSNDTVVLGGLITDKVTTIENKVPLLADLPLVGALFRSTSHETIKSELIVFLTPSINDEE